MIAKIVMLPIRLLHIVPEQDDLRRAAQIREIDCLIAAVVTVVKIAFAKPRSPQTMQILQSESLNLLELGAYATLRQSRYLRPKLTSER